MKEFKRQQVISLIMVVAMMVWLGVAAAVPCAEMVHHFGSPPSVLSGAGPTDITDWDEDHDDRYLDWRGTAGKPLPAHLSVRRGSEDKL